MVSIMGSATLLIHTEDQQNMARRRGQRRGWLRIDKGTWLLTYRDYAVEGAPRVTKKIGPGKGPGKLTKKQAERFAWDHYLQDLDKSVTMPASVLRVEQFWEREYLPHLKKNRKYATVSQYQSIWTVWLEPVIGAIRLFELSPRDINAAIDKAREAKKSSATAKHIRKVAGAVIEYAKSLRMFSGDNPAHLVEAPVQVPVRKSRSLSIEQVREWLEVAKDIPADVKDKRSDARPLRTMSLLGILCSLGISEQLGLTWQHVNLTADPVVVGTESIEPYSVAVFEHSFHGRRGTLKTGNRRRIVPLPKLLVKALRDLWKVSAHRGLTDPVLAGQEGKPVWADNLQKRHLKKLAVSVDLPWLSWHVFRHTCATLAKNAGMFEPDRQVLMGHAPRTMTDRYTHEDWSRLRAKIEEIAADVDRPSKKTLAAKAKAKRKSADSDSQSTLFKRQRIQKIGVVAA